MRDSQRLNRIWPDLCAWKVWRSTRHESGDGLYQKVVPGNLDATMHLAQLCEEHGNYPEALEEYQKASLTERLENQNEALYTIGNLYENGLGVPQSLATALEHYEKA